MNQTALQKARSRGTSEIVNLIEEYEANGPLGSAKEVSIKETPKIGNVNQRQTDKQDSTHDQKNIFGNDDAIPIVWFPYSYLCGDSSELQMQQYAQMMMQQGYVQMMMQHRYNQMMMQQRYNQMMMQQRYNQMRMQQRYNQMMLQQRYNQMMMQQMYSPTMQQFTPQTAQATASSPNNSK